MRTGNLLTRVMKCSSMLSLLLVVLLGFSSNVVVVVSADTSTDAATEAEDTTKGTDTEITVSARVISCQGCQMESYIGFTEFFRDGEIQFYENVTYKSKPGSKPAMRVYHNDKVHETISLAEFETAQEIRDIFVANGLQRKSETEIQEIEEKMEAKREAALKKAEESGKWTLAKIRDKTLEAKKRRDASRSQGTKVPKKTEIPVEEQLYDDFGDEL